MATILVFIEDMKLKTDYVNDLRDHGFSLTFENDLKSTIKHAHEDSIDIVILDTEMPILDKIEAMGEIVRSKNHIPVILNTCYHPKSDNFQVWSHESRVVKTSNINSLRQAIKKYTNIQAA